MSKLLRVCLAVVLVGCATTEAEALPLGSAMLKGADQSPAIVLVQARNTPGYYAGRQYRRAMRRYRGHPGAQYELRQNRHQFCEGAPEYC